MSRDSRLGVDPLGWVDANAADEVDAATTPTEAEGGAAEDPAGPVVSAEAVPREETPVRVALGGEPDREPDREKSDAVFRPAGAAGAAAPHGKGKVKIREKADARALAQHLRELADALEGGGVALEHHGDTVVLDAPENAEIECRASRKKGKAKCSIKISWEEGK